MTQYVNLAVEQFGIVGFTLAAMAVAELVVLIGAGVLWR